MTIIKEYIIELIIFTLAKNTTEHSLNLTL